VVVRFSRTRKRYERQGVLVQPEALEKAEEECLADADLRAARQARDAERREAEDSELAVQMAEKIRALFPGVPAQEANRIAAIRRSVAADALAAQPRVARSTMSARSRVRDKMEEVLERWRQ
jgi:hypothetical protein